MKDAFNLFLDRAYFRGSILEFAVSVSSRCSDTELCRQDLVIRLNAAVEYLRYFRGAKAVVAGGCFKDIICGKTPKDFDIVYRDSLLLNSAVSKLNGWQSSGWVVAKSNFGAHTLSQPNGDGVPVELLRQRFGNVYDVLNDFDFTCCKIAYDFETGEMLWHELAITDCLNRVLRTAGPVLHPASTIERCVRYAGYGYEVPVTLVRDLIKQAGAQQSEYYEDESND